MSLHGYMNTDSHCVPIESKEHELSSSRTLGFSKTLEFAGKIFDKHKADVYCVFAMNDYAAISVYKAATQRGLKIGKDVFVAGFGNMPLAVNSTPTLTTVDQNPKELGYAGAKTLYDKTTGNIKKPINCIMPVDTIIRESSVPQLG